MKLLLLSDLHMGHRSSRAPGALDSLSRLAAHFDRVIVNGDALETCVARYDEDRVKAYQDRLKQALVGNEGPPQFITGNHDPDISSTHYLYIEEAQLLIFHGDFMGKRTAPWIQQERILEERLEKAFSVLDRPPTFDERVHLYRETQIQYLREYPLDLARPGALWYVASHLVPPTGVLAVLQYWRKSPDRIAVFASSFGKPVKHVVFGHTHRAGVWSRSGMTLYNTGSFMPLSRPHVVIVESTKVTFASLSEAMKRLNEEIKPS